MTLTTIALQNLRRRKGRTAFLLFTFVLVSAIIVCLQALAVNLQADLQKSLTQYGANVIITPRSEHLALSYGGLAVPGLSYEIKTLDNSVLDIVTRNSGSGIQTRAPKVIGKINFQDKSLLVVGVDFASELKMKPWWKINGKQPQAREIVAGATVAKQNSLAAGSTMNLNGLSYSVAGIMQETGGSEDNVIFTDIPTARVLTENTDSWSMIELNSLRPDQTVLRLSELLPAAKVEAVSQLVQGTQESVDRFRNYALFASLILVLIGILIVAVTVTANVNNRAPEIGVFRAIGFRKEHILGLFLREILLLSLSGSIAGYVLGAIAPPLFGHLIFAKSFTFHLFPGLALLTIGASLLLASVAVAFPAWRAASLDSTEALRCI